MNGAPLLFTIDAGHGGLDSGAVNPRMNIFEKDINISVALWLNMLLKGAGYHTWMSRTEDATVSLYDRVGVSNEMMADYFISIHANAREGIGRQGLEVESYHYPTSVEGNDLSEALLTLYLEEMAGLISVYNRGNKPGNFYTLRMTRAISVTFELGFVTDDEEALFMSRADSQEAMAKALFHGIEAHLG